MTEELAALHDSRRFDACYALLDQALRDESRSLEARKDLAVFIVERSVFFRFDDAIRILDLYLQDERTDLVAFRAHAYASWVKGEGPKCIRSSGRAIVLKQDDAFCYRILGMHYLSEQRFLDAYAILGAGLLFASDKKPLMPWMILATNMLKGAPSVDVVFDGLHFTFGLTCFNGMAMESSMNHLSGRMNEPDELRMVREEIRACRSIVECGSLVGNHTLFFAKALKPERIVVLDADEKSLSATKRNFELNPDLGQVALDLRHCAISPQPGEITLFGKPVRTTTIDAEAPDDADFIKIDVDGMEMAALRGMRKLISRNRPLVLIEISNEFSQEFRSFLDETGYEVRRQIVRGGDGNYLIAPRSRIT